MNYFFLNVPFCLSKKIENWMDDVISIIFVFNYTNSDWFIDNKNK